MMEHRPPFIQQLIVPSTLRRPLVNDVLVVRLPSINVSRHPQNGSDHPFWLLSYYRCHLAWGMLLKRFSGSWIKCCEGSTFATCTLTTSWMLVPVPRTHASPAFGIGTVTNLKKSVFGVPSLDNTWTVKESVHWKTKFRSSEISLNLATNYSQTQTTVTTTQ